MTQTLKIGTYELTSRLIVGTGKYPSMEVMRAAHAASGADMVTVAIRRINLDDASGKTMLDFIDREKMRILPNTAGCYTAKDAVLTAELARELLETDLIKLEVIGDAETLYPDGWSWVLIVLGGLASFVATCWRFTRRIARRP